MLFLQMSFVPNRFVNIDVMLKDVVSEDGFCARCCFCQTGLLQDVVSADVFLPNRFDF
jgi:hypothetical protein